MKSCFLKVKARSRQIHDFCVHENTENILSYTCQCVNKLTEISGHKINDDEDELPDASHIDFTTAT